MSLNPQQIEQAAKMYAEGRTLEQLSVDFQCAGTTMRKALTAHGVKFRSRAEVNKLKPPMQPINRTEGWDGKISNKHLMLRLI